jgi:hypothetical protein
MTVVDEEFRWSRDREGYEIKRGRPLSTDPDASLLAQIVGEDTVEPMSTPEPYRVSDQLLPDERLYENFANIKPPDEESKLVGFCNKYGVPTDPTRPVYVRDVVEKARLFRLLMDAKSQRPKTLPSRIDVIRARFNVALLLDHSGKLTTRANSKDLFNFMVYEAIQDFDRQIVGLICECCKKYFLAGPGTARRADSLYCTEGCREKKKEEKKERKRAQQSPNVRA